MESWDGGHLCLSHRRTHSWEVTFKLKPEGQEAKADLHNIWKNRIWYLINFIINQQGFISQMWLVGVWFLKKIKTITYYIPGDTIFTKQQIIKDGISIRRYKLWMRTVMISTREHERVITGHLLGKGRMSPICNKKKGELQLGFCRAERGIQGVEKGGPCFES